MATLRKLTLLFFAVAALALVANAQPDGHACTQFPTSAFPAREAVGTSWNGYVLYYNSSPVVGQHGSCSANTFTNPPTPSPYRQITLLFQLTALCAPGESMSLSSDLWHQTYSDWFLEGSDASYYSNGALGHFDYYTADCGCYPYGTLWQTIDYGC